MDHEAVSLLMREPDHPPPDERAEGRAGLRLPVREGVGGEISRSPLVACSLRSMTDEMTPSGLLYRVWKQRRRSGGAAAMDCRPRLLFSVGSPDEARAAIRKLQEGEALPRLVRASACEYGLEVLSTRGWVEWLDAEGRGIMEPLRGGATGRERDPAARAVARERQE